jgi:CDP-diacylglycerol--inositol 3-phosphatidyltransferase
MCAGNELFFSMLYLLKFFDGPLIFGSIGLFKLVLYLTAPVAFLKAFISAIHLVVGSKNVAIIDVAERQKQQ